MNAADRELIDRWLDGELPSDEEVRLASRLEADPEAVSYLARRAHLHGALRQGETFTPRSAQSEDCLFLNIWTPAHATADSKLPVLFWIHGGAFIQGSGAQPRYDGTELAKRGAVVISLNYLLGSLGLFAHPALTAESTPDEPLGNYCLLDMIAALRWTRDNIAAIADEEQQLTAPLMAAHRGP